MAKEKRRAIEGEINRLRSLALDELRSEWRRHYASEPPQISRDLLVLGLGARHATADIHSLDRLSRGELRALWTQELGEQAA